jgi:hypothetical protein
MCSSGKWRPALRAARSGEVLLPQAMRQHPAGRVERIVPNAVHCARSTPRDDSRGAARGGSDGAYQWRGNSGGAARGGTAAR